MRLLTLALCVLAALYLGFSATPEAATRDDPRRGTVPPLAELEPGDLLPLRERTRTFEIVDGEGEGRRVTLALARVAPDGEGGEASGDPDGGPERWRLRLEDRNELHLVTREDGALAIERIDIPHQDKAVLFEPAVLFLPADPRPDERWADAGTARILALSSGEVERAGPYAHRVLPFSRVEIRTPAGVYQGFLLELEHDIELDLAEVRIRLDCGLVPDEGIVYRRMKLTIDKPAFFGETTERTAALAE